MPRQPFLETDPRLILRPSRSSSLWPSTCSASSWPSFHSGGCERRGAMLSQTSRRRCSGRSLCLQMETKLRNLRGRKAWITKGGILLSRPVARMMDSGRCLLGRELQLAKINLKTKWKPSQTIKYLNMVHPRKRMSTLSGLAGLENFTRSMTCKSFLLKAKMCYFTWNTRSTAPSSSSWWAFATSQLFWFTTRAHLTILKSKLIHICRGSQ